MSDDIKQRLRTTYVPSSAAQWTDIAHEAAAEIERLEAELCSADARVAELERDSIVLAEDNETGQAETEALRSAIDAHNNGCDEACGVDDQEGVRCGYRDYFPRRCPECPKGWKIDMPDVAREGGE